MELQTLPIGEQSFIKLRSKNRLYVDKTEYIYRMIQDGTCYFLSRPRRFGKSLLLNTIEAYFQGKRELFEGLYIGKVEQDWFVHPVMHLDFSAQSYDSEQKLYNKINAFLAKEESVYGSDASEVDLAQRFEGIIQRAYQQSNQGVVILVDEYDKPLLETIANPELQDKYRNILRGFYAALKSMDTYISFALLTGITKFSKVSIFSDLNNLNDISRDRDYASICGITDVEVDSVLSPYIQRYAEEKNLSYDAVREDLRMMYDGYHFVDDTPGLYNPFSVMNALSKKVMGRYWFDSGTPTMLVELFQRNHYPLPNLEESIDTAALDSKDGSGDSIVPLLYQSGYLSVLRSDEEAQQTWLAFPNKEVNEGFFRFLLPYYSSVQKNRTKAAINTFVDDLRSGNVEQFLNRLQSFFADFQYDTQTTPESHFRNVLYILCKLIGLDVDAEYQTSDGRIDLLLRTDKFVYVFECKIDSTAKVALQQIKSKEYALPWALDNREKILIGLNFSTATRRPDGWIIERGDGLVVESGPEKWTRKVDQKSGPKTKRDSNRESIEAQIILLITEYPDITTRVLAEQMGRARSGLIKHLNRMQADGLIQYDTTNAKWIVIAQELNRTQGSIQARLKKLGLM